MIFIIIINIIIVIIIIIITTSHGALVLTIYTFLAYVAITFHMTLVKEFGGIATVMVGNTRKALTIVLSFTLFPKPLSWLYFLGGVFVFGGLIGYAYWKDNYSQSSRKSNYKKIASVTPLSDEESLIEIK